MAHIFITGVAGFIGSALALRLLERGERVYGIDNLNDYYDVTLKQARLERLKPYASNFQFMHGDLADRQMLAHLFAQQRFDIVINLAAQAGVRYSIEHPQPYIDSNLVGFANILEGCRHHQVEHLLFASSSSVYGTNAKQPFCESDNVDHPISLYAATKKANELMAHTYAHLYRLPCTGLRFFTVYGPWMRPDMALFKFAQKIMAGSPLPVYNYGQMSRDFTYIDDIIEGVVRLMDQKPQPNPYWDAYAPDPATSQAPYRIYNLGHHHPVELLYYIQLLEKSLGKSAQLELLPMQPGDVPATLADTRALFEATHFLPQTSVEEGVSRFAQWFKEFYHFS